jgi:hypothetical protein
LLYFIYNYLCQSGGNHHLEYQMGSMEGGSGL